MNNSWIGYLRYLEEQGWYFPPEKPTPPKKKTKPQRKTKTKKKR